MSAIQEYIRELEQKIDHLQDQIKSVENKIHQEKLAFEHNKSALKDQAAESTKEYKPKGLAFSYKDLVSAKTAKTPPEDIKELLNQIYKI